MFFGLFSLIVSDILELYLLVNGVLSSIKSIIGDASYDSYYTNNEFLITVIVTLIISFIIALNSIKRNSVIIKYRFRKKSKDFDLYVKTLKQTQPNIIDFRFIKGNDKSFWIYLLNKLYFSLLIEFKCPWGVTIDRDREAESQSPEFKLINESQQILSYSVPLHANGIREISISLSLRDDTRFAGNDSVNIKTYIAFDAPLLRNLFKLELGYDSIDILPSSR